MRARFALALVSVIASIAFVACGEGGNGTGTAPPQAPPCPTVVPAATDTCPALQVCDYPAEQKVAVCSYSGAKWELHQRGEAGVFADAEIPEIAVDSATEAGDATDETDAEETTTTDATDAAEETSASDSAADAPSDG